MGPSVKVSVYSHSLALTTYLVILPLKERGRRVHWKGVWEAKEREERRESESEGGWVVSKSSIGDLGILSYALKEMGQ